MNLLSPFFLTLMTLWLVPLVIHCNDWTLVDAFRPTEVIRPSLQQQQQQQHKQAGRWSSAPEKTRSIRSSSEKRGHSFVTPRKAATLSLTDSSSSSSSPPTQTAVYWHEGGQRPESSRDDGRNQQEQQREADVTAADLATALDTIDFESPKLTMAKDLDTFAFCSLLEQELKKKNNDDELCCWLMTGRVNPALFSHDFIYTNPNGDARDSLPDYCRHVNAHYDKASCLKADIVSMKVKKSYFNHEDTITVKWRWMSSNKKWHVVYTDYVRDLHSGLIGRQHDYSHSIASSSSSSPWKEVLMNSIITRLSSSESHTTKTVEGQRKAISSSPSTETAPTLASVHKAWSPTHRRIVPSTTTTSDNVNSHSHTAASSHPPRQGKEQNMEPSPLQSWAVSSGFHVYFADRSSSRDNASADAAAISTLADRASQRKQAREKLEQQMERKHQQLQQLNPSEGPGNAAPANTSTRHDGASQRKETRERQEQQELRHDTPQAFSEMAIGRANHLVEGKNTKQLSSTTTPPNYDRLNPFVQAAAAMVEVVVIAAATALGTASAAASTILLDNISKNEGGRGRHKTNHHPFQAATTAAFDTVAAVVTGGANKNLGPNRLQLLAVEAPGATTAMAAIYGSPKKNPMELALAAESRSSSELSSTTPSWLNVTSFWQNSAESLFSWYRHQRQHHEHGEHSAFQHQLAQQLQENQEQHERNTLGHVVTKTRRVVPKTRHELVDHTDEVSLHQVYASSQEFTSAKTISLQSPLFLQHVQNLPDEEQDNEADEEQDHVLPVVLPRIKPTSVLDRVKNYVPADHEEVVKSLQWASERTEKRRREWNEHRRRLYDAHHQAQVATRASTDVEADEALHLGTHVAFIRGTMATWSDDDTIMTVDI